LSHHAQKNLPSLPSAKQRIALLILLAAVLFVVVSSDQLHHWLLQLLAQAEGIIRINPVLGILIFVLFAAASATLAFVSSAVIIPIGVYTWGQETSTFLLWAGWILGGVFAYSLSRFIGRPVLRALKLQSTLKRFESSVSSHTPFPFVVLLQIAMPSELVGYLLGIVRYPFWKFLAALAIAELPYAVATVYLGSNFLERRMPQIIAALVVLSVFSALSLRALRRRLGNDITG
jgi:uncharacterized membrane protein YdjX (TVP38/TMEM64 family)